MKKTSYILFALLWVIALATGCKDDDPVDLNPLIIITQGDPLLNYGEGILFTANKNVDWFAADSAGGTIDDEGVYTAPNTSGTFRIVARSKKDPTETASTEIVVSDYADQLKMLQEGGFVIHFRHAIADSGADGLTLPGVWWKSCDPDTARQLSAAGKLQALQIGTVVKKLKIPVNSVVTSEYCRCRTTGEIMNFGLSIETSELLTFAVYDEPNRHPNTLILINDQTTGTGANALLIGHSWGNGFLPLPQISQGDAAIFRRNPGASPEFIERIPAKAWTDLYRIPTQ